MTAGEAAARRILDTHGNQLMRQCGAFAVGLREEASGWVLVLTVAAPPPTPPPAAIEGIVIRVEQGEAMRPL